MIKVIIINEESGEVFEHEGKWALNITDIGNDETKTTMIGNSSIMDMAEKTGISMRELLKDMASKYKSPRKAFDLVEKKFIISFLSGEAEVKDVPRNKE